jgi:hypothetical protein
MSGRKAFVALAVTAAFGVLGITSAVAGKDDMGDRMEKGGICDAVHLGRR